MTVSRLAIALCFTTVVLLANSILVLTGGGMLLYGG